MRIFLNHTHVPFGFGLATAFPEFQFVCPEWYPLFRPVPENVDVRNAGENEQFDVVITSNPSQMFLEVVCRKRILVVHLEAYESYHMAIRNAIQSISDLIVVTVSRHRMETYGRLAIDNQWRVISFCIPESTLPYCWSPYSKTVGSVHNSPNGKICDFWQAVSGGHKSMMVGHHIPSGILQTAPQVFESQLYELSTFACGVNVVAGNAFGMAPHEIAMSGIPLVTPDNDDVPDYFQHGVTCMRSTKTGFDAVPECREYIRMLLGDKKLAERIGKDGRQAVIENVGEQATRRRWLEILE